MTVSLPPIYPAVTAILLVASLTAAHAQSTPIYDKADGRQIGTAYIDGNRLYLRDINGEHYATVVRREDGTKVLLDQHGKPLSLDAVTKKLK